MSQQLMYSSLQCLNRIFTFVMVFICFLNMLLHTLALALALKTLGILLILTLKECISIYLNMCKFLLKIYLNLSNELCSARLLCVCNIVYSTYSCLIQILRKTTVLTTRYVQSKSYSFKPPSVLGPSVLGIQVFCTMTHATIFFLQDRAHIRMMQYKSKCCYCAFLVI